MKFWFFIALLANLVLFLWEFQNGAFQRLSEKPVEIAQADKQILLVSELVVEPLAGPLINVVERKDNHVIEEGESHAEVAIVVAEAQAEQPIEINEFDQPREALRTSEKIGKFIEDLENTESKTEENDEQDLKTKPGLISDFTAVPGTEKIDDVANKAGENTAKILENFADKLKGVISSEPTQPGADASTIKEQKIEDEHQTEAAVDVAEGVLNCYEIGPFENEKSLSFWLKKQGITLDKSQSFYKNQPLISAYLVYYPAGETYAESKRNQKMLEAKGITDLWLFRKGELKGAISLGLFKNKQRAERMVKIMDKKGVQVEWVERYNTKTDLFARLTISEVPAKLPMPLTSVECVE